MADIVTSVVLFYTQNISRELQKLHRILTTVITGITNSQEYNHDFKCFKSIKISRSALTAQFRCHLIKILLSLRSLDPLSPLLEQRKLVLPRIGVTPPPPLPCH